MLKIKILSVNYKILMFALLISINSSYADELNKNINGKFDAGGINLHLECYGSKSPSIIVQSGYNGYGSEGEWGTVIEKISQKNRICIYDRAHMGKSDKLTKVNTIYDTSKQLHTLLKNVDVKPPYLMVGHSYGSYPLRAYNHLYPKDVVGILLIDPSQYGQWSNLIAKWKPETEIYNLNQEADRLEELSYWNDPMKNFGLYDLKANENIIKETPNFKDTPLVILWAKDGIWVPEVDRGNNPVWTRMKNMYTKAIEDMHKLSSNMKIEFSRTTEHNIHFYEPETVIKQLNYLLKEL
jgi:pimeloyl-ACP methyl ester carboxylesterase